MAVNVDLGGGVPYNSREYREKILRLDAEEPASWITVNGNHIPLDKNGNAVGGQKKALGEEGKKKPRAKASASVIKKNAELSKKVRSLLKNRKHNPYASHSDPVETWPISTKSIGGDIEDFLDTCEKNGLYPVVWGDKNIIVSLAEDKDKAEEMFPNARKQRVKNSFSSMKKPGLYQSTQKKVDIDGSGTATVGISNMGRRGYTASVELKGGRFEHTYSSFEDAKNGLPDLLNKHLKSENRFKDRKFSDREWADLNNGL